MKTMISYFFIIGIAGVLIAGFLSDWLVKRKGIRLGRRFLGVIPLSLLALTFLVAALTSNNTVVVISLYIGQLFYSFTPVVSFSTCVDIGGNRVGTIAGIMNFFGQAGAFFLAIVFGKIADMTHSFNIPLLLVAGVLFVGSMLWFFVDASRSITAETYQADMHA
jgi:sugar phosphate permease